MGEDKQCPATFCPAGEHEFTINENKITCSKCHLTLSIDEYFDMGKQIDIQISKNLRDMANIAKTTDAILTPLFSKIKTAEYYEVQIEEQIAANQSLSKENDSLESEIEDLKSKISNNVSNITEMRQDKTTEFARYTQIISTFVDFISKLYNNLQDVGEIEEIRRRTNFSKLFQSLEGNNLKIYNYERNKPCKGIGDNVPVDISPTITGNRDEDGLVKKCDLGYSLDGQLIKRGSVRIFEYDINEDKNREEIEVKLHYKEPPEVIPCLSRDVIDLPFPKEEHRNCVGWIFTEDGKDKEVKKPYSFEKSIDLVPKWDYKPVELKFVRICKIYGENTRNLGSESRTYSYGSKYVAPRTFGGYEDYIFIDGEKEGVATESREIKLFYRSKGNKFEFDNTNFEMRVNKKSIDSGSFVYLHSKGGFGPKAKDSDDHSLLTFKALKEGSYKLCTEETDKELKICVVDQFENNTFGKSQKLFVQYSNLEIYVKDGVTVKNITYTLIGEPKESYSSNKSVIFTFKKEEKQPTKVKRKFKT